MKRILIYAQDGLEPGDLRCMRSLGKRLLQASGQVALRVISGTPPRPGVPRWQGIANTILPGLRPTSSGHSTARGAGLTLGAALQLRMQVIRSTISDFTPDLILVDKLPFGMYDELAKVFVALKHEEPTIKFVLLLRDLIGCPQSTGQQWRERGYFDAIAEHYEKVLVLGEQEVFDLRNEYSMPERAASKLEYCGYVAAAPGRSERALVRRALGVPGNEPLVVVTAGAGSDGEVLIRSFLQGLKTMPAEQRPRSHIVCDEGMRESERLALACAAHALPQVTIQHVSRDLMSLMSAADVVVTNGGYQKTCELLTLHRRAVIVPSAAEAQEQTLRAERLAAHGLLRFIRAHELQPQRLIAAVMSEIMASEAENRVSIRRAATGIEFVTTTLLGLMELELDSGPGEIQETARGEPGGSLRSVPDLSLRIPTETGIFAPYGTPVIH